MDQIAPSFDPPRAEIIVEPLARAQARAVYPLMREADPSLTLARWLRYASHVPSGRPLAYRGVLVARRRGAAHPCGAVCYRRDRHINSGAVLTAEHLVALDLLYPEAITAALLAALDALAAALGCTAVRSIMQTGRRGLIEDLRVAGHRNEGVTLRKPVQG